MHATNFPKMVKSFNRVSKYCIKDLIAIGEGDINYMFELLS